MKSYKFNIVILIFLLMGSLSSEAQLTNLTVTILNKSFPERSDWGESLRITRMDFWVNDKLVGSVMADLLSANNSILTRNDFELKTSEVISKIEITCIHHTWNVFGDKNETVTKTYDLATQNLDGSGIAGIRSFSQFIELPMAVSWSFSYQVRIAPFKPGIINTSEKICYHDDRELSLSNNEPGIYYIPIQYEWQYGFYSTQWIENPDFRPYINEVASLLTARCSDGYQMNCQNIYEAVGYSDYNFMNEYEALYNNPDITEKYEIANHLLNGILINQTFLSGEEQNFLRSNFITVVMEKDYWAPPNTSTLVVANWQLLGTSSDPDGSIVFFPKNIIDNASDGVTRIVFQVRALADGQAGSFSKPLEFGVYPKAPVFSVTTGPSCKYGETGILHLSDVSGVYNFFKVLVRSEDFSADVASEFFSASIYTPGFQLRPGKYNIDVYYQDNELGNCSVSQLKLVEEEKELQFTISGTDATCPEKSDGQIKVNITQYANYNKDFSSCNIKLGETNFNSTAATFTGLDNQAYNIKVSDFCTSGEKSVSIGEQNVVNVITSAIDPACKSAPDGSITILATGSTNSLYDFELLEGPNLISKVNGKEAQFTFGSLHGGSYTVKSRSALCTSFLASDQKSLSPVEDIDFGTSITHVKCFGASTGEIELTASGGKSPYYYKIGSNEYVTGNEFPNLTAGTYQMTVHTNNLMCDDFISKNITINSPSKIQIGFDRSDVSCFEEDDGSLKANVSGGSGDYTYSWQEYIGGTWYLTSGNSSVQTSLYAGRYKVNVTDSNDCAMSAEDVITEPSLLVVESAIPKDVVCYGENGSITLIASGGSGGYEYSAHEDAGQVYKAVAPRLDLPAGNYYVSVKDAKGCEATYNDYADVQITAPASRLDFSFTAPVYNGFNLKCNNDNSGSADIVASGGNGSGYSGYYYALSGAPDKTTGSFTGLSAGTYNMKVTDGRGCIVQKPLNLTEPPQLNLAILSTQPVKCFGASTGEIRVSAAGGISGTYKYRLDGTEMLSPGIFNNLYADTYEVEVSDINGCRQSLFATVQSLNPPIGIVMIPEDVRCFGENNGKINTIVSGGSGGFIYSWEMNRGSGWQAFGSSSGNLTDLVPAKYRIKATDSESCYDYRESEIREPSRVVLSSATSKDVICYGGKGSVSISASGGTPEYTYYCREKSGTVYDSPLAELQLPAGVFNISIKDGKGCQASYTGDIQISAPPASVDFTATLSSFNGFNVSCNGRNDGFLIAEASGGNGSGYSGYKYSINGSPDGIENHFNYLAKGSYLIRVTDARGCKIERTVSLNEPQPVSVNLLYSNPVKCFGEPTGEFSVKATGGIENTYKYRLNGESEFLSGTFNNLYPGSYTVDVTDINGCSKNIQTTIVNKNQIISVRLIPAQVRCNGENNGSITSLVSGGAGGFSYSWEKRSGVSWQNIQGGSPSAVNLYAGFYRLKLRDADNCPASDSIAVIQPAEIVVSKLNIKDAVCFGEKGSFEIEAANGNGGYSFYVSADAGATYNSYNSGNLLIPASYRIKVRDIKGCESKEQNTYSITGPGNPLDFKYSLSQYGAYNISCHGNEDGSISLLPIGGNDYGYSGYLFKLNGADVNTGNLIKNLSAGNYEASLIDGRGCRITKTITLSEPVSTMNLKIASIEQPKCVYDKNGVISLFAEGGYQPYEYSVNGSQFGPSSVFSNLAVAKYVFKVRDANGCSELIDASLVNLVSEMEVTGIVADVKCYGENSGAIDVQVKGGADPYSFRWKDDPSLSSTRSALRKGDYTVTITDAAGCASERSFLVSEPDNPLRITAVSAPACAELKDGTVKASADGGTPPYLFAIDRRSDYAPASQFDVFPGNHNVYVSDLNNCFSEVSVVTDVRNVKPEINFMLATSRYELDTLVIIDVSVPVPEKVKWEFPEGTIVIDTTAHKAMIKYTESGLYPVKMTGKFGTCIYSIEKLLNISPFDPLVSNEDRNHTGIKSLVVSPNPNDGRFIINLELYEKQEVAVKLFDFYSRVLFSEKWPADISFRKEINLPGSILPGNYVLWIIGENDSRPLIVVISR